MLISSIDLDKKLKELENIGIDLSNNPSLLGQEIMYIFSMIKNCEKLELADDYFAMLEKIQATLALLLYKENLGLPDSLRWFTNDFDRIDDQELKQHIFSKIKEGSYTFGKKLRD